MDFMGMIYLLLFTIAILIGTAIFQIRMAGIKIKDFIGFIQANEMLDKLYKFSKRYNLMSPQEQIIFLSEAEKVFKAYDKILLLFGKTSIVNIQKFYKHTKILEWIGGVEKTRNLNRIVKEKCMEFFLTFKICNINDIFWNYQ